MSDKVQKALREREARKRDKEQKETYNFYQESSDKVAKALEARKSRIQSNIGSIATDLEKRVNTAKNSFSNYITKNESLASGKWSEGVDLKSVLDEQREDSLAVSKLMRDIEAYRSYIGDDVVDKALESLTDMDKGYKSVLNNASVFSKYKTEDEYNAAVEYDELVTNPKKAAELATEIEDLEARKTKAGQTSETLMQVWGSNENGDVPENYTESKMFYNIYNEFVEKGYGDDSYRLAQEEYVKRFGELNSERIQALSGYKSLEELEADLSQKKQLLAKSGYDREGLTLTNEALNAEDFELYSKKGEAIENPGYDEAKKGSSFFGKKINNIATFARDNKASAEEATGHANSNADLAEAELYLRYASMTPEEVSVYNYYLGKYGEEKAEEYLYTLEDSLSQRRGAEIGENVSESTIMSYMWSASAGLDQFTTGMKNLFNTSDKYVPTTTTQYASQGIRENIEKEHGGIGTAIYDLGTTTFNMAPSLVVGTAVGTVNPVAGAATSATLMGASAKGNAYVEKINAGWSAEDAQKYSIAVGISEAALQYALGGISKAGGALTKNVVKNATSGIKNGAFKAIAKYGVQMAAEGFEEGLQEILDLFYENLALGYAKNGFEDIDWEEAAYSAMLGALSSGVFEGGGAVVNTATNHFQNAGLGKSIKQAEGGVDALTTLAADTLKTSSDENNSLVKAYDKVANGSTKSSAVGKLLREVSAEITTQNKADLVKSLERKGLTTEEANSTADTLLAVKNGQSITKKQAALIEDNLKVARTLRDVVANPASTVSQRTDSLRSFNFGIEHGVGISSNTAQTKENIKNASLKKEVAESELKISDDGKTTNLKTGKAVEIQNIDSISESGEVNLTLDDKMVVKASDVAFSSPVERAFVENIGSIKLGKKNISTASANALYQLAKTAWKSNPNMSATEAMSLVKGLEESYIYGAYNFGKTTLTNSESVAFAKELTEEQRTFAYELGTQERVRNVEAGQKAINNLVKKAYATKDTKSTTKKGRVRFEEGVVAKGKLQKRTASLAKHLARAIGIDVVFYDARTTRNAEGKDSNGYFDVDTDTIYLDLQNAHNDAKTIAFTLSHELVHFIKKWSPAKFDTFATFLTEQYAEHGVSTEELVSKKMKELGTTDKDLAYEEMIADACETMLLDSNAVYKLMELRKSDLELFEKIKLHIHELLNNIRDMYKKLGLAPTSDEAKALLGMQDVLEQMYSLFEEASVDAAQNYQAVGTLETESVSVSEDGTIKLQMKQYQQTGRATLLNYLKEQYGAADANDLIATIDNIYNTMAEIKKDTALSVFGNWQDTEVELDENGHPIFTTSINNGDYKLNQDFSRVCKKRRQLDFVLNMLAEDPAFEASNLTKDDIVKINQAIKTHGFEIACALCFVDSKRFRQTEWADSFANTWNDILYSVVGDKSKLTPFNFATQNPNLADDGIEIDTSKPVMYRKWSDGKEDVKNRKNYDSFDSMLEKKANGKFVEGNANVRAIVKILKENPHLRHTFRGADIIGSQGFDTIQRLAPNIRGILDGWGGTSVPKPSSNDAIYDNSVLNITGYNAKSAFAIGGVRMNSFSDFMAHMFFDYVQAFADLSAKGLPMHSYTKELDFARLFGLTKGKINMSAIAAIRENATDLSQIKKKADKDKATEWEKSIAGLDISKVAEKLGKAETDITYDDIIQNLDACEYVWADESIDVRSATLLQSGIMYDNLTEGKAAYCYELIKEGKFEEAFKVAGEKNVNRDYAKHLGIITVGVSKAHILKLLRDPTIRMVIPYHKSGLNAQVAAALKIAFYEDFTDVQNTMLLKKDGSTVGLSKDGAKIGDKNIGDFNFYKYFGKTIDGVFYDGKATAAKYVEWCENGEYNESVGEYGYYLTDGSFITKAELDAQGLSILPKFNEFAEEENYYKLVEDFDCYDTITGEHSPQEAVDLFHDGLPADYKGVLIEALKAEQRVSDDFRDHLDNQGLRDEVMEIVKPRGYKPSIKKQAKKIRAGMSENERYSVLKDAKIVAINDSKSEEQPLYNEIEKVPEKAKGQVEALIKDLADDLEILNVPLSTTALDIEFQLSKNNGLRESLSQQLKYGGNFHDFSKALINLRDILNRAILVEVHTEDRYKGTVREDVNFEAGYVLFSAFKSQEYVIPVKLEIKQKKDVHNILYVVVSMTKIKRISVMESALDDTEVPTIPLSDTDSVYSLPHLVSKINPKDRDFLKYLPDQMLNTEQSAAKNLALKADKEKLDAIPKKSDSVKKQLKKSSSSNAPTFYSQMGKVVEGIKQEKLAANSVVNMLRGKGVKAEEIRWSGIVPFLEGKKSVTKQELLDFINGSMLQIEEKLNEGGASITLRPSDYGDDSWDVMRGGEILDTYSWSEDSGLYESDETGGGFSTKDRLLEYFKEKYGSGETRWGQYKLDGGSNYREIVFTLPNSSYRNQMMKVHWGEDAEGVLVHARIQDFDVNGKKMLFIEEIQSDWHNEGHKEGYQEDAKLKELQELEAKAHEAFFAVEDYSTELTGLAGEYEKVAKTQKGRELLRAKIRAEKALKQAQAQFDTKVPNAPFKDSYHEYVLKRLLRMATEQGYDSIGWTPADIQDKRWDDHQYHEEGKGKSGNLVGYTIEYDQDMVKFLKKHGRQWGAKVGTTNLPNGTEVWSMDLTDSMKESVLTEGQPLFQKKTASNRSILANALEGAAQNDIEKNKLKEYKEKIDLINAEEQRLSEIQQQLFTKGGVEPENRKALQFEAKQIANRINTYDRQLLRLEAAKPLQDVLTREKEMARKRQKQKDAEAMKAYKEKVAKTTRELMTRHQESRKKAVEGREKTAMRHKIQKVVGELNSLLTHGNKKKHVPEDLKTEVAEVLELFNMDTVGAEERIAKLEQDLMKAKTPEKIQEISRKIDHIREMGDRFDAKLKKLKSAYDAIKSSADPDVVGGFDDVISNRIEYVASKVGKTPIRYMTLEQLEMVYDVYTMVLNNIREANSLFKKEKAETIQNYASRVIGEVKQVGGEHKYISPRTKGIKEFLWNNQKPIYAFEKIGSKTLTELFEDVRSGEDTWAVDITDAKEFSDSKSDKYNYKKWDLDKKYTFKSTTGEQFSLTLEQMLSLYAYSKRPQAGDHLRIGGFVFDDSITTYKETVEEETEGGKKKKRSILKYKVNIASPHQISIDTLADIVGNLTAEQKAFVDEMQTYLSDVMGAKGNEVSMTLYNVRLFKEKFYFPLKSAKQFMFEQNEVAGEVKIKNSGFTESTVEHANNPIILNNFMDVWANHVNDMAMYHSFVVPLENFNRVFNYQTRRAEGMPPASVKATLQNAYGSHAVSYIRQLLTDLNGGVRSDPRESTSKQLISRFKKAKVFTSASVVIQQPSAVARALALIDAKYFDYNPKLIKHAERWEELKKYAPVVIIKEMGHFDTDMGMSTVDYIKGQKTLMQKADDLLSKAPSYADELTWVHIWEAVKRETQARHKDLKVGSEEFLKAAGKRFTEVATKTQVYDSVLSRSANMRSKSALMSMVTAFMAESTTAINMVEQGFRLWKRGYKKLAIKHLRSVGASVILNAALVSLVFAGRDDDEDETFLEKYLGSFTSESIDGLLPFGYYPIVKDAWSLLQGYSVERTDMSLFADIVDAAKGFVTTAISYDEDMTDEEAQEFKNGLLDNSLKLVDSVAALFGISSGNIRRDVEAVINTVKTFNNDFSTSGLSLQDEVVESVKDVIPIWGWFPDKQKVDKLYDAIISGDTAYVDRLKSGYKDDKAYEQAVRKALRENDPRIKEAAEARMNGDIAEYSRIVKAIKAEGGFVQDTIVAAVNAEINALSKGEDAESSSDTNKVKSMYKIDDYYAALDGGDEATAYVVKEDLIETDVANGKDREEAEESFNGKFTSYIREQYEEGNLSDQEAERMLVNYGDKAEGEAASKVQYWEFKQEYPDYDDLSEEAVSKYYEEVEPYGINVDVYYDYSKQKSKCKGVDANGDGKTDSGSKKAEILKVINSLPISRSQKDVLYYLNGWSAKTIYEAPWH